VVVLELLDVTAQTTVGELRDEIKAKAESVHNLRELEFYLIVNDKWMEIPGVKLEYYSDTGDVSVYAVQWNCRADMPDLACPVSKEVHVCQ
jgi:hypothetical protein